MASIIEQQEATSELVRELQKCRPRGSNEVLLTASVLSSTASLRLESFSIGGVSEAIRTDYFPIDNALYDLRDAMYTPGVGTWFGIAVSLSADDVVTSKFNYDDRPDFGVADVDPIAYVTDQEKYPREVQNQPEWLRELLRKGQDRLRARGQK